MLKDIGKLHREFQKRELIFFYQPEFFSLYIPETGVTLTQNSKLLYGSKEISIEHFWHQNIKSKTQLLVRVRDTKSEVF